MVYNIISAVYSIIGASDFNLQGMQLNQFEAKDAEIDDGFESC
ncbi:MAG TPA: hypothetical protein VFY64_07615 [Nitrososphaeraceae archaeon]|nr:hypothetical protein [Nitrososphaeraceae archaeon]